MQKNPLRYLGLIGILGLLGIITENTGLFGLFGFFGFFGLARQRNDEMLRHNLARAGLNAFMVSLIGFPAAATIISFIDSLETVVVVLVNTFAVLFVIQILTFVISFNLYEKRGDLS
ncbi:MAG: DUF3796 domain-containing protein [Bacillota bacterium]|nr:DUF3796 domain-containing protein [Bacillota bacterium]